MRGDRLLRQQAVVMPFRRAGRGQARLPRGDRQRGKARCGRRRQGLGASSTAMGEPSTARAVVAGAIADAVPQHPAAGAFAAKRVRRAARSWRPGAEHIPDLAAAASGSASSQFRRPAIGAAVDAGAQFDADISVIGLVGERAGGAEFLRTTSAEEGLARSVVVATSDEASADAAAGGLSDARDRGIFPRRRQGRAVPEWIR